MPTIYRLLLILSVVCLFSMGLVTIFNTTSAEVLDHALSKSTHHALVKQMMYAIMGLVLGGIVWKMGYQRLLQWSPHLLAFFVFLLILTLIPGIGREVNGSRRWLAIAGFSVQPSEFVKILIPAFLIYRLDGVDGSTLTFKEFIKLVGIVMVPFLLILVEPNNGTAGVIGLMALVMCVMMRISFKFWAWPLVAFMAIGVVSITQLPYVQKRFEGYMHPELDLRGKGHQPYQAKIAAGSGQLWGKGPGNSLQKLSYLPESQNDYIAAIYAEEFGFVGMLAMIVLYLTIATVGCAVAFHAPDKGGCYLATAVTFLICFQAFMNLGVVSGLLPSTGLNLPFFSQGGTSLMANLMGLGLLLNIGGHSWKNVNAS